MDINLKLEILEKENEKLQEENNLLIEELKTISANGPSATVELLNQYKESYYELLSKMKSYENDYLALLNELAEIKDDYKNQIESLTR
ncbi:hypothetical protein [Lachnoclostridium sp.]|uniref:hypothetical protein n=1 Tax=Lachnoclostridium sp. TaxID=2028282 RepID=UPI0028A0FCD1|nr:hypothetical protein [Lachnoclostridium sp.]